MVVPLWRCPILKPLSAKLPPKSETAPHPGWQDGTILGPGTTVTVTVTYLAEKGFDLEMTMGNVYGDGDLG